LKMTGLKVLQEVANEIEAVLAKFRVGLMTALTNYDQSSGANKETARTKALQVVKTYQDNLPKDKHVIAADTNPFGVKVTIRQTLGAALATLNTRLEAGR
jgi:predicted house-cleaning NTP pyrophosphatase (Maf/HAM1 superfamily)